MGMSKYMWITWERQRRSVELAEALGADLYTIEYEGFFRYAKCICKTVSLVRKKRPYLLFVQNPSMLLAFFSTCFLKPVFSLPVVVDRHSNFLLTPKKRYWLKEYLFNFLSYITIRHADLTIVTNDDLAHVVRILGGRFVVLPDKIPALSPVRKKIYTGDKKLLVISSFAEDEPIEEILQAFGKDEMSFFSLYISGNSTKLNKSLHEIRPNITLTGYLSDVDYVDLLFQVDAVIVLTKMEYTLLCGCYEAISAEKPLITSNSAVLHQLFTGAMFVQNDPDSIADGVRQIFNELPKYKSKSLDMKRELILNWDERFEGLKCTLNDLKPGVRYTR